MIVPNSSTLQRKLAKEIVAKEKISEDALKRLEHGDWRERSLYCFIHGELGKKNPAEAFKSLKEMADDDDWRVREAVATALTEISGKHPDLFLNEMKKWVFEPKPNVRRAAVESLRVMARKNPKSVTPIIEPLFRERNRYVRDAVAHILREATKVDRELVVKICLDWLEKGDKNTLYIVKHGSKKLPEKERRALLEKYHA